MHTVRRITADLVTTTAVLALAACGTDSPASDAGRSLSATSTPGESSTTPPATSLPGDGITTSSPRTPRPLRGDTLRIHVTIGDQQFHATLTDSAAARALRAQLPLTVEMSDHGSVEKTGPLPAPLSLDGQPAGADPDVGDVGYYAPGNDLVFYYGDQSYFDGIVVLGRMDAAAAERLATMDGSVTATVTAADN